MANENMIQKHEDNFLAKIAGGATPVDTNVRNSKEFWLDKIADWTGGKSTDDASTKKIYYHPITIVSEYGDGQVESRLQLVILNTENKSYTKAEILYKLKQLMDAGALINVNGYFKSYDNAIVYNAYLFQRVGTNDYRLYGNTMLADSPRGYVSIDAVFGVSATTGDGVNAIN